MFCGRRSSGCECGIQCVSSGRALAGSRTGPVQALLAYASRTCSHAGPTTGFYMCCLWVLVLWVLVFERRLHY